MQILLGLLLIAIGLSGLGFLWKTQGSREPVDRPKEAPKEEKQPEDVPPPGPPAAKENGPVGLENPDISDLKSAGLTIGTRVPFLIRLSEGQAILAEAEMKDPKHILVWFTGRSKPVRWRDRRQTAALVAGIPLTS